MPSLVCRTIATVVDSTAMIMNWLLSARNWPITQSGEERHEDFNLHPPSSFYGKSCPPIHGFKFAHTQEKISLLSECSIPPFNGDLFPPGRLDCSDELLPRGIGAVIHWYSGILFFW